MLRPRTPLGWGAPLPDPHSRLTFAHLFIKFVNPPRVMLCLVAYWCSDLVNLVVTMELSTDLNETHENQNWRNISISRIIFLALENWTVWIGCNKQLLVLISESRSTVDSSNYTNYVARAGGGQSKSAECQLNCSSWSGFKALKANVSESVVRVFDTCSSIHTADRPQQVFPSHVVYISLHGTPCMRADTHPCCCDSGVIVQQPQWRCLLKKYWYRILPKNSWKSIADTHFDTTDEKYWR